MAAAADKSSLNTSIREVLDGIVRVLRPQRIILFGSRARGCERVDSDLDLLIIYDGPLSKREAKLAIRRTASTGQIAMDLFVLRPSEWDAQRHVANSLAREAAEHGLVCYG